MNRGHGLNRSKPLGPGSKRLQRNAELRAKPKPEQGPTDPAARTVDRAPVRKRKAPRNTGPGKATQDKVKERARYACEWCHRYLGEHDGQIHHRHGRQMGGTRRKWINLPSNLLYLCPDCHRMVTDTRGNRDEYEAAGLLLREGADPLEVPIVWGGGQKLWLLNEWPESESGYWQPNPDDLVWPPAVDDLREDAA